MTTKTNQRQYESPFIKIISIEIESGIAGSTNGGATLGTITDDPNEI